jgi:DNA replication licensing factor MCM6
VLQTSLQITPSMVREAYALLRQSIIHVEQDDIDFEDDTDEVLPAPEEGPEGIVADRDRDADIDMADIAAAEAAEATYNASSLLNGPSSSAAVGSELKITNPGPTYSEGPRDSFPLPRRKLRITCKQCRGQA